MGGYASTPVGELRVRSTAPYHTALSPKKYIKLAAFIPHLSEGDFPPHKLKNALQMPISKQLATVRQNLNIEPKTDNDYICLATYLYFHSIYYIGVFQMDIKEIKVKELNPEEFIEEKTKEISSIVGDGIAINALSGGVDSSTVTMLGHKALGDRLKTYFIENGLMRANEPQQVVSLFKELGVHVEIIDAKNIFFKALKGITDPEEKRKKGITKTFYQDVFGKLVKESGAKYLLQGTIYTDVEETVAGIKRQHNVLEQLGIDTEEQYGYKVIEPLIQLRKDTVRVVAKHLGLPESIYNRMPFPGPALAARVIGEVTEDKIEIVRKATEIVEEELAHTDAFQYMAILHEDRVTGMRNGQREFGRQIEVRCWDSIDATVATPTKLPYEILKKLADRITKEVPGVVSVTYNIAKKPPSTMEVV
jgi:GMP synthase (glutamine-hydrolysing)